MSHTFCHFYETIYESQQCPYYNIAFCYNDDKITKCNSEKDGHFFQAHSRFFTLLLFVFFVPNQFKPFQSCTFCL